MAGFQTAAVGTVTVQRGRPATPVVDIRLVRPAPVFVPEPKVARSKDMRPFTLVTTSMVREMRMRRERNESLNVIATAVGVTTPTVRRHTRDIAPPAEGWQTGGRYSKVSLEQINRLRRSGFTYDEIGENFGVTASSIWRRVNGRTKYCAAGTSRKPCSKTTERVSRATGVRCDHLRRDRVPRSGRSCPDQSKARHILFWALVRLDHLKFVEAANALGGFDHTSVLYGVRRVESVMDALGISAGGITQMALFRELWAADWPARTAR